MARKSRHGKDYNQKLKSDYWQTLRPIKAEIPDHLRQRGRYGEWVLQGFQAKSGVAIHRYNWDRREAFQKYSSAKLRQLRAERGVGGRPKNFVPVITNAILDTSTITNKFAVETPIEL